MIKYVKDILVLKSSGRIELYNEEEIKGLEELSNSTDQNRLLKLIYKLSELENNIKWSTQKLIMFQAGVINLCNKQEESTENLLERVEKIEKYLRSGNVRVQANNVQTNNLPNRVTIESPVIKKTETSSVGIQTKNTNISTKKYPEKSEEYWPQIVSDLKQNGKIVLYTNLMNSRAVELNDMTVGIEFPNGLTSFGKTVLEKQENINEISKLVSIACGKEMQIKYIDKSVPKQEFNNVQDIQNLANGSDIPFNVVE